MNKVPAAKTLLLGDTRKVQAIADFVKSMFMRDIVPIEDLSTQNCLYEAWLEQISNSDFMYHSDTGEQYSPLDLRTQLLYNMVVNYEAYYPQVVMHLDIPYRLGTVNSNTVNSKFHLIQSFCQILARFLSFHV